MNPDFTPLTSEHVEISDDERRSVTNCKKNMKAIAMSAYLLTNKVLKYHNRKWYRYEDEEWKQLQKHDSSHVYYIFDKVAATFKHVSGIAFNEWYNTSPLNKVENKKTFKTYDRLSNIYYDYIMDSEKFSKLLIQIKATHNQMQFRKTVTQSFTCECETGGPADVDFQ